MDAVPAAVNLARMQRKESSDGSLKEMHVKSMHINTSYGYILVGG